jgi:hypothetical protein
MSIYPVVARIQGPLAALAEGYANDLTRLGYAPASIRLQMKVLADLSGWLLRGGVVAADLKVERLALLPARPAGRRPRQIRVNQSITTDPRLSSGAWCHRSAN